jgi:hypothetical protein
MLVGLVGVSRRFGDRRMADEGYTNHRVNILTRITDSVVSTGHKRSAVTQTLLQQF